MRKSIDIFLLVAFATFVLPATQLVAAITLPNLPAGSQYQLIFVTAGTRDALSSNIADYNSFVTAEAALNSLLPNTTWHAVASTIAVNAFDNAPSVGLPVYNIAGELVAASDTGLYTNSLLTSVWYNQFGGPSDTKTNFNYRVWTGIGTAPGTVSLSFPMGPGGSLHGSAIYGNASRSTSSWDDSDFAPQVTSLPLYALSGVITVAGAVPEPAGLTVWGSLILLTVGLHSVRRRSQSGGRRRNKAGSNFKRDTATLSVAGEDFAGCAIAEASARTII